MNMVGGRGGTRTRGPLLAKQVLSQLSYTPTVGVTFILKHFHRFQNPFFPNKHRVFSQSVWRERLKIGILTQYGRDFAFFLETSSAGFLGSSNSYNSGVITSK